MINLFLAWTDSNTSWSGNFGMKILNFFKLLRGFASQASSFFETTIDIGGTSYNLWQVFGVAGLIILLTAILVKKIVPLA